jgi:hypothetical protein
MAPMTKAAMPMMSVSHQGRCCVCSDVADGADVAVMMISPCYDDVVAVNKEAKLLSGTYPGAQRNPIR